MQVRQEVQNVFANNRLISGKERKTQKQALRTAASLFNFDSYPSGLLPNAVVAQCDGLAQRIAGLASRGFAEGRCELPFGHDLCPANSSIV